MPPRRRRFWRRAALICLLVFGLPIGWRVYDIVWGGNFHTVVPNICYRGAQPTAADLARLKRQYGLRTIINLRGVTEEDPLYWSELDTAAKLDIKVVDVGLWSTQAPSVEEFRKLVRSLTDDPPPFFVHCYSGSDRTGMASALFLLLRTDATLPQARRQLSIYYGHIPHGRASCQDEVLDSYERWLTSTQRKHSPELLRHWGLEVYDGF